MQRESLNTRQGSKAGKIRVRTGREKMRPPPLSAKEKFFSRQVGLSVECEGVVRERERERLLKIFNHQKKKSVIFVCC